MGVKKRTYIKLHDLDVYKLSKDLSKIGWNVYETLDWQTKKIMGDQFIESTDSVGANIAEGYARFHYLDKIKFFYNARASLAESSMHWLELFYERTKISEEKYKEYKTIAEKLLLKINNFITINYRAKNEQ